jgi:hypothetical protein
MAWQESAEPCSKSAWLALTSCIVHAGRVQWLATGATTQADWRTSVDPIGFLRLRAERDSSDTQQSRRRRCSGCETAPACDNPCVRLGKSAGHDQMGKRRRYKWYWRVALAGLVFLAVLPLHWLKPANYVEHGLWVGAEAVGLLKPTPGAAMGSPVAGWGAFPLPPPWLRQLVQALKMGIVFLPNLWLALLAYDRLTFAPRWVDGHTYCGHCGRELQGLGKPNCPWCGAPL